MFIRHLFKQYEALTFANNREGIFLIWSSQAERSPTHFYVMSGSQ